MTYHEQGTRALKSAAPHFRDRHNGCLINRTAVLQTPYKPAFPHICPPLSYLALLRAKAYGGRGISFICPPFLILQAHFNLLDIKNGF